MRPSQLPEQTLIDEVLGRLEWDPGVERWTGSVPFADSLQVDISVCPDGFDSKSVLANARRTFVKLSQTYLTALEHIVDRCLPMHNDGWSDDGPISRDEFLSRISPAGIGLYHDGSADYMFYDGGLFGNHAILIYVSASGDLLDVTLEG